MTKRIAILAALIMALASLAPLRSARADDQFQVSISLKDDALPASDLVYQGQIISPQQAWALKSSGVDLSTLEPDATTDIYKAQPTTADESADAALPIQNGDLVGFQGVISSSEGHFRFNVQTTGNSPAQTLTLMISEDLHTYLLRKELLRKLGYQIPAMKYLPKVRIRFPDALTRDFFLNTQVPNATYGAATRWQVTSGSDPLVVTFQDLVAMEATPLYYNVALGAPIQLIPNTDSVRPEEQRILRALALTYDLINVPESVNEVDWYAGLVQNDSVVFSIPDEASFAATLDDALWILRKISTLTRADYAQMVAQAYFPKEVAAVLVEKIIARRDSLLSLFGLKNPSLAFDAQITDGSVVQNGKIMQQDWPGYASRFAHGDPTSPLADLKYYLLSEFESNMVANLLSKANSELPSITIAQQSSAHNAQMLEEAWAQFIKTGAAQSIHFGVWAAPIVGGALNISRDVVLGSYMGTDNLVQLADNFGFTINAGVYLGVDGLPTGTVSLGLQGMAQGSLTVSIAHLKPLTSLKQAVTEPIQNEFVPWLVYHASGVFNTLSQTPAPNTLTADQLKKQLSDELDQLKTYMGVGESIIITQSLSANESVNASVQVGVPLAPGIGVQPGSNQLVLSRINFYRKDDNTIIVFKDDGALTAATIAMTFTVGNPFQFPVVTVNAKGVAGTGNSQIFTVNVNPDPSANPSFYSNASALAAALRTDSVEVLASQQKPTLLSIGFQDNESWLEFFSYVCRNLRTNGNIHIGLPDGTAENFISMSDGTQTGESYQSLATEAANYLIQWMSNSGTFGINTQTAPDPGQTFMGTSTTRQAEIQARSDSGLTEPFFNVQYRWEGWDISSADMITLVKTLNTQYAFKLYPDGFLNDTTDIQLYELALSVNVYQSGLEKLLAMSPAAESALETKYNKIHNCNPQRASGNQYPNAPIDNTACSAINRFSGAFAIYRQQNHNVFSEFLSLSEFASSPQQFFDYFGNYWHGTKDPSELAQSMLEIASSLEQFASFDDLVSAVGGTSNMFVTSKISGFRIGSENLSTPIQSNTYGTINADHPGGALDAAQGILGIDDGEFDMQWIRDKL